MFLVLCDSADTSARWAYEGLGARGLRPLELVTSEALAYARWAHRVGAEGASVEVGLPDGRTLCSDHVRGTLNRLLFAPQESLLLIHPSDREYVTQELTAFYMSWLWSLPGPVFNRPTPQTLCGRIRHISEWLWLAGRAGIPVPRYRHSGLRPPAEYAVHARVPGASQPLATVIVVDGQVVGAAAPSAVAEGCLRLAELAELPLMGIEFSVGPGGDWEFAGATTYPDLSLGGGAFLDRLASALEGRNGAG